MKHLLKYLLPFALLITAIISHGQNAMNTPTKLEINASNFSAQLCESLYNRWLIGLNIPSGDESGFPPTEADQEIFSNKIAMAYFMCDKIANAQYTNAETIEPDGRLFRDAHLLNAVAGIDLFFAEDKPPFGQDFNQNLIQFATHFSEEWRTGVYKDPSKQIKQLSKEGASFIREHDFVNDLAAIRRYGIFGVPELIRQIKQHNSKHAFAAYLIVTARREDNAYSDYLFFNDEQFPTAEEKIACIKKHFEEIKKRDGGDSEVMRKISAALNDSIPITAPKPKMVIVNPSTEFLKTITNTNTGQYAVVNASRDTVILKDTSNRIIWSTNVIKGIEEIGDDHWDPIREMQVIGDTLFLTEGHGNSASINISTGNLRYSNRKTILRELGH